MDIQEYLSRLIELLGFSDFELETNDDEQNLSIKIVIDDKQSGILIGRHGETLGALRRLVRSTFTDRLVDKHLILTVNDYHDQREDKVKALVERGVRKVQRTHQPFYLYRLNAAERFFAHNLLSSTAEYSRFHSYSIDDEDGERVLVIDLVDNSANNDLPAGYAEDYQS